MSKYSLKKTKLKKGWDFNILPFNLPEVHFGAFEPIVKLYRSKIDNNNQIDLPTWKSFKFADFKGWHHHIALSEIDEENYMPCFRIMPSGIVNILDRDVTGGTLDSIMQNATRKQIQQYIKDIIAGPNLGISTGVLPLKDGRTTFLQSLYLPLTVEGQRVEQFIHAISLSDEETS